MRYIEFQIIIGDAPAGIIFNDIKEIAWIESFQDIEPEPVEKKPKSTLWQEGTIHFLDKETYIWTFSLIYREGNFDIIKWKTASAWKEKKEQDKKPIMNKALFIGADGGVFFIKIDEEIYDNFNYLADMMDVFLEKTKGNAPFLVYAVLENKEAIAALKTNKEMLKNLADVKKWTTQHGGEFRLENLKEIKMNLHFLINDYCHYILTNLKSKYKYSDLRLGEVHYIDYEDISALAEIEEALAERVKEGETTDELLYEMLMKYLKGEEFIAEPELAVEKADLEESVELESVAKEKPATIKQILKEIRLGIRRQCPKCFNKDRNKIFEVIDKNHIIMQNPTIYGFKYRCGMCGHEWKTSKYEWDKI
ncbi:MAG: hypothetical protein ACTSVV_17595 [Promethearchaeota archaeon]